LGPLDKMMRYSLTAYPPQLTVSFFYPALSTYKVANHFSLDEFRAALAHYFHSNPIFSTCELQELEFETPDSFSVNNFQRYVTEYYLKYFASFLVLSVRYKSNPNLQGIFTVFPIQLMDGFKAFMFHQALMKTLKSKQDEFHIKQSILANNLKVDDLAQYMPVPQPTISPEERLEKLPFTIIETEHTALKIPGFLEKIQKDFIDKECKNLVYVKNSSPSTILFGSFLMILKSTEEIVVNSTGEQLKHHHDAQAANWQQMLSDLDDTTQIAEVARGFFPGMAKLPALYIINNYGNVNSFLNKEVDAEKGHLIKFQWHMPFGVLALMKAVIWTITIGDKAFTFSRSI